MLLSWPAFLLLLTLVGCVSTYSPPGPVVPLLRAAGDVSVGANVRPAFPLRGANVYGAAAPSEHTRVTVSGSLARYDGREATDFSERTMHERNHTTQLEAGAGWGTVRGRKVIEVLAGAGVGRTAAHACRRNENINGNYGVDCELWVNSRSWFVRPFVQAQLGMRRERGHFGGGARISVLRYAFEDLMGSESTRASAAVTLEPFFSASWGYHWGKLEAQFLVPFVAYSPAVHYQRTLEFRTEPTTFSAKLIETASPRFTVGLRGDLTQLWGSGR